MLQKLLELLNVMLDFEARIPWYAYLTFKNRASCI